MRLLITDCNTYKHRDTIKRNGGQWSKPNQCWIIPKESFEYLIAVVQEIDAESLDALREDMNERAAMKSLLVAQGIE